MTNKANPREIVVDMLADVLENGKFSHRVIARQLKQNQSLERQERAFISRLFNGTIKHCITLDYVIDKFSTVPVRKMKPFIRNLLRMSVYQLIYMDRVPESAVCNEAAKLAKKRGFGKLSGFVNGNLRNIVRQGRTIEYPDREKEPEYYLEIKYSVPMWLAEELLKQYSYDTVETMLEASLKEKETTIRCNKTKISPEELKTLLSEQGITVEEHELLDYAFRIKDYDYLEGLDSFRKGLFTVQDVSSMLVCESAGIQSSDVVMDVCAAPGGKALHCAEKAQSVLARDLTEYKIELICENIERLDANNITAQVWDASMPDPEWIGKADIVIADLPCSGWGVLGKKADIKYKLTQNQHKELVELQRAILAVVQQYVKPGGVLIYSTCTVNREENTGNLQWILENFEFDTESLDPYLPEILRDEQVQEGYLQLIQGVHPTDGFFISRLRKRR